MKQLFLPALTAILLLTACSKTKIVTIPYSKQIAADFNFKPGSWWVYVDSITEHRDSVVIVSVINSVDITRSYNHKTEYHREYLWYQLRVYSQDSAGWQALPPSFDGFKIYDSGISLTLNNLTLAPDSANYVNVALRYPFTPNTPSIDLRGNTYTNVVQEAGYYGLRWHNLDVGFIKMPGLKSGIRRSVFELEKCSIVR